MTIRGAIFDVDGTLLDSMPVCYTIGEVYLRSIGVTPAARLNDVIKDFTIRQSAAYCRREYGLAADVEEITAGFNALLERHYRQEIPLKPGVRELLALLRDRNVRLCVATATDRFLVEAALDRCGVLNCFDEIFTCTSVGHSKAEPHIFEAARRFLGAPKPDTLVFEDALYAARTAKRAGFPVAAVYDSCETKQEELRALADVFLEDLTQSDRLIGYLPPVRNTGE